MAGGAAQPETKYARLGGHRIAYQVGRPLPEPLPPDPLPPWEAYAEELDAVMDAVGAERAALLTAGPEAGPMALFFAGTRPERTGALILADATARYLVADAYPIGVPPEATDGSCSRSATSCAASGEDRGPRHLKGVEGAWQLFAVGG